MFKTIVTLMRGAAAKAEEDFADRHALLLLDQQIRDAAAAIERAKRALAIAIAQDEAEGKRLETTLHADRRSRGAGDRCARRRPRRPRRRGGGSDRADGSRPRRHQGGARSLCRRRCPAQVQPWRMPAIAWRSSSAADASRWRRNRSGASKRAAARRAVRHGRACRCRTDAASGCANGRPRMPPRCRL